MALSDTAVRCVLPGPVFPLSVFFLSFCPMSPMSTRLTRGKGSRHLMLSRWHTACLASSKPACLLECTSDELASAQISKSLIRHQILPLPFYLQSSPCHLFHPHLTPEFLASRGGFLHPLSPDLNLSCIPTCQLNTPLHRPCSGRKVAHCYGFKNPPPHFLM